MAAITLEMLMNELISTRKEMNQRFDQVERRLDKLEHRMDQLEHRMDQLEHRMDQLEHRMDQLEHRMDQLEHRMDQLEHRMDQLEHRMDQLETEVKELKADVSVLKSDVLEIKFETHLSKSDRINLNIKLDRLDSTQTEILERLKSQEQDLKDLKRTQYEHADIIRMLSYRSIAHEALFHKHFSASA